MTYQTTLFDVDSIGVWHYLGVTKDTYIDFGKSTNPKSVINWEVDIEDRSFGIVRIVPIINDLNLHLYWQIPLEDISDICRQNLETKFECEVNGQWIEGRIMPSEFRDYKVINEMDMYGSQMIIMDILIDFINKQIIVR